MRRRATVSKVAYAQVNASQIAISLNNVSSTRWRQRLMRVPVSCMNPRFLHRTKFRVFTGKACRAGAHGRRVYVLQASWRRCSRGPTPCPVAMPPLHGLVMLPGDPLWPRSSPLQPDRLDDRLDRWKVLLMPDHHVVAGRRHRYVGGRRLDGVREGVNGTERLPIIRGKVQQHATRNPQMQCHAQRGGPMLPSSPPSLFAAMAGTTRHTGRRMIVLRFLLKWLDASRVGYGARGATRQIAPASTAM